MIAGYFDKSLAFFMKMAFLCLVCTNEHSRLTIHCELFYSSFTSLFPHLNLFLMQILSILFSGSKRLKTGKSGEHKKIKRIQTAEDDEDKVKNII